MTLWHIDTNHKLKRWRFVSHVGIDVYSRLSVYLKVASDNTSATAFTLFTTGIQRYGIAERVRADKGLENINMAEFMLASHGTNSKSFKQRIERFWREIWQGCACTYYTQFRKMEQDGILDVDYEINIVVLHLVYLNRIQSSFDRFVHAVSRRPLRTENNKTPLQLWIMGQMKDPRAQLSEQECMVFVSPDLSSQLQTVYTSMCESKTAAFSTIGTHGHCPAVCCYGDFCSDKCFSSNPDNAIYLNTRTKRLYTITKCQCDSSAGYKLFHDAAGSTSLCIQINTTHEDWDSARMTCSSAGGDIVVLDTKDKASLLRNHIPTDDHYFDKEVIMSGNVKFKTTYENLTRVVIQRNENKPFARLDLFD